MTSIEVLRVALGVILMLSVAIPIVVYLSVKLGTWAYLRSRQLFEQDKGDNDGDRPRA